ncbi:DUF998 domain-containing protein [Flavobacterium tistrianum]|uniref:DUF998 domain-containing protein n=1 Tax=Flavobacterium tistrianum TaxID=1685414 RepID=UPI000DADA345|nr:DUF998 domain-containing protein [Flavobacterium tistrianum]KAF2341897.1 DUF998 domain-containing protein [Flavobacterium tistrianum]
MKTEQFNWARIMAVLCIMTCIFDFIIVFLLGNHYSGYSQLKNTMSSLGASISPVSNIISTWWICIGMVFICFGIIFRKTLHGNSKNIKLGSLLIILYGLGEGIGSGLFKADKIDGKMTNSFMMHSLAGGVGVLAALLLPLVLRKAIVAQKKSQFYIFSWIIFAFGFITTILFTFRFSPNEDNFISLYKGLWQRLFMLNLYVYFIVLSVIMYRKEA